MLPTRKRTEQLKVFLKSAIDTKTSTKGIVLVSREEFINDADQYRDLVLPNNWDYFLTDKDSMGEKVSEYWDLNRYKHKFFGILNDDFICRTDEWDKKAISNLNDGAIGFVSTNDGWKAPGRAAGACCGSASFFNAIGYFYPQGLKHSFVDDAFEILGAFTGCWKVDMTILMEHDHVTKNELKPKDSTFLKASEYYANDCAFFENWIKKEMNKSIENIRIWQVLKKYTGEII